MKVFAAASGLPANFTGLVAIPVEPSFVKARRAGAKPAPMFRWAQKVFKNQTRSLLERAGFEGERGQYAILHAPGTRGVSSVFFFPLPDTATSEAQTGYDLQQAGAAIAKAARDCKCERVCLDGHTIIEEPYRLEALLEGILLGAYSFEKYRSPSSARKSYKGISELIVAGLKDLPQPLLKKVMETNEGIVLARDLANTPAADCTPAFMAETARALARSHKLACRVYGRADLQKLHAGGILSVAQGSAQEPALITLTYTPKKKGAKKVAIVGKGVTFDSGGICLKPSPSLDEMKYDMGGAAAVMGAMRAVAALKPAVEVCAYIPVSENMVDGKATHPGDIIRIMNGKTVEVLNTDAEGRLLLADAISLAEQDGCDEIIDLATLTGAIVIALGVECAGLFSPDDALAGRLLRAASAARERLWRMPLLEEYREQIKSKVADLKNIGDKSLGGGSITGALFLQEFVSKTAWAHLDIAGPVMRGGWGKNPVAGATGYGVRTLVTYLMEQSTA